MRLSDEIPGNPGARPSLSHALDVPFSANRATHRVGEHRVARLMRHDALRAKAAKQWQATTHSSHCLPVVASALDMPSPFSDCDLLDLYYSPTIFTTPRKRLSRGSAKYMIRGLAPVAQLDRAAVS